MAANDGSLIFDTELDNSGFEKGSDKLLAAVKDLTNAVDNLGDNMMKSFSRITPMLQSIATSASNVSERITQTASQAADANERIIKTEEDAAAAAQKVVKANEDIAVTEQTVANTAQQTAQAINSQNAEMVNFSTKTANASANISSLEHEIDSISSGMRSISSLAENGFSNGKSVLAFDDKLTEMQHRLDGAREKLEAFGATKIPTDDYIWVTEAIQRTEAECDKLLDKQAKLKTIGVSENSQRWKSLEYEIQLANEKLTTYKNDLQGLIYLGKDFTLGADTDVFKQMQAAVNETKTELDRNKAVINAEAIAQARLNVQAAQERVIRAQNASERAAALEQMKAAQNELNRIAESVANNSERQKPPEVATTGWLKFATALRKAGSAAMKTAATLAKMTFRGMANGLKAVTSKLKSFTKTSKQSTLSAHSLTKALTSIRTILVSRIKSMLISSITNAVKDGIHALAQYSKEFDNAMSNMRNRTKEIGANISVTIGNLIKTLEPLITQLLQGLSTAITYINAFMAVLSGSNTVTVAKKQTESYAASLKDATNNAKDLKAEVYGFDELNKRSGADMEKANEQADLFEEVPVTSILPEQVQDVFDKVKQAAENQDWQGIGKALADGLNNVFSQVNDWINNVLRPNGTEWARRIAEIFNGLTSGINWTQIGQTTANGINTVFAIAKEFLTTYDFKSLGEGIGDMVAAWFVGENAIDWNGIGETFAAGLNAIIDLMYGIVDKMPSTEVGIAMGKFVEGLTGENGVNLNKAADGIATGLNKIVSNIHSFINYISTLDLGTKFAEAINRIFLGDGEGNGGIDWTELGATLAAGLNFAVLELLKLMDDIKWGEIGAAIGEALDRMLNGDENGEGGLDWENIGKLLADGFNIAVEFFKGLFTDIRFDELGSNIVNALKTVLLGDGEGNGGIDWENVGQLLYDALDGAIRFAFGLITGIDWGKTIQDVLGGVGKAIANADLAGILVDLAGLLASIVVEIPGIITGLLGGISDLLAGLFHSIGWDGIAGFFEGLGDALADATSWLKKNLVDPVVNSVKQLFGIHSPSTVFAEIGDFSIQGLLQGISDAWGSITDFFSNALGKVSDFISSTWDNISSKTSKIWNGIKTSVSDTFNAAKDNVEKTVNNIKSGLETGWNNIKSTASDAWNNIKSTVSGAWDNIKTNTETTWNNVKSTTENLWNGLHGSLASKDFSSIGTNLVDGLKTGISNAWNGLTSFVSNCADGLTNTLNNVFGIHSPSKIWAETGMYLDEGLLSGLKDGEKSIISMVSGLARDVNGEMIGDNGQVHFDVASNGVLEQITAIADRLSDIALQFRAINTFLTDAGNFNVPIIASGTEIPYKTRIAADTPGTGGGSFTDDLDERLSDQTYILRQILNLIQRFKNVDGDALLRAIEALRMADRSYGV